MDLSHQLYFYQLVLFMTDYTREIAVYGGVVKMPIYAAFFLVFTMANIGLPGTSGFVGEFLTLLGAFKVNLYVAFLQPPVSYYLQPMFAKRLFLV